MSDSLKTDQILDKHLQVLRSKDESLSSLSIATESNGASVSGDLNVTGALKTSKIESDTESVSINRDVKIDAKKKLYLDDGEHTYLLESDDDVVEIYVGADRMLRLDKGNSRITYSSDTISVTTRTGTEYSVADSGYAGMILGYSTVGIDATDDSYTLTTSTAPVNPAINVSFVAPPSGVVEIMAQIYFDAARRIPVLSLLDNDSPASLIDYPNANDVTNEHIQVQPPSTLGDSMLRPHWVVTGLTPGGTYKWWLGAKTSAGVGGVLKWGGDATNEYPPAIMRATALPAATTDFAVYG